MISHKLEIDSKQHQKFIVKENKTKYNDNCEIQRVCKVIKQKKLIVQLVDIHFESKIAMLARSPQLLLLSSIALIIFGIVFGFITFPKLLHGIVKSVSKNFGFRFFAVF